MTITRAADPLSGTTQRRVARLRLKYATGGLEAVAGAVDRLSPTAARAALILALATEHWTEAEKAAMDPHPARTTEEAAA